MTESHTVVIVEDDPPTRAYLVGAVDAAEDLHVAGNAGTLAEGRQQLDAHQPSVLLIDLALPDGNGLELIGEARDRSPKTLILVITVFGDEQSVLTAIAAGAQGYLLKDSTTPRIAESIRELIAGGAPISPPIARHLLLRFQAPLVSAAAPEKAPNLPSPARSNLENDPEATALSARETEVLELVVKGFTFPEIARMLEISTHTVTTHVRRIYRKLAVRSRSEAVYEALQQGIVSVE